MSLDRNDLEHGKVLDELFWLLSDDAAPLQVPPRSLDVQAVRKATCNGGRH